MLEVWIILTFLAALFFAIGNVLDKFVLTKETRDCILASVIAGYVSFVIFGAVSFFTGGIKVPVLYGVLLFISGGLGFTAVYYYYKAMGFGEVSRVTILLSLIPIFVLTLAFFVLGERLVLKSYIGIFIIVSGALLISYDKSMFNLKSHRLLVISVTLLAVVFFAFREIINKYSFSQFEVWPLLFWFGLGNAVCATILLLIHHPHLKKKAKRGLWHLTFISIIATSARVFLLVAVSLGSVSLVSALLQTKPLIVLVLVYVIGKFKKEFLPKKLTKLDLTRKIVAVLLVIIGGIIII